MINVMLDPLPAEWNGYEINTSFRIGIQVFLIQYDKELNEYEKSDALIWLLFDDREHPVGYELQECVEWFFVGYEPGAVEGDVLKVVPVDELQAFQFYHSSTSTAAVPSSGRS